MKVLADQGSTSSMIVRQTQPVLGVLVDAVSFINALNRVLVWGHARTSRFVVLANVHVVITASREPEFGAVVAAADMVTPDGAPVAWMLGKLGNTMQQRVSGPDLTWALLGRCEAEHVPVYFFGSSRETLAHLATRVNAAFPALLVAGFEAPPFRPLTEQEDVDVVDRINSSGAGLVFVGLGCPKQEHWMLAHRGRINAVMLGVGAAFDFHAGTTSRAPAWMREHGLEWLHRLCSEPRRLWKRYLVTNTLFVLGAIRQLFLHRTECQRRRKLLP
jgi:N-acetylglucosaminyldiphosphoundecaprenol N-acetyl-beta-D-mannosaminyltransferase